MSFPTENVCGCSGGAEYGPDVASGKVQVQSVTVQVIIVPAVLMITQSRKYGNVGDSFGSGDPADVARPGPSPPLPA